jgi:integral membrane protein (TIGR00529 family)
MLNHIPAILRLAIVFVLILIAIRKKLSLGNSFLLGSLALSALFSGNPRSITASMVESVLDPKTVSLAIMVGLILILSNSMEKAGQMQRLLASFHGLTSSPRLNLTIFPALIGLLPMPGGAVFSAPMVKELGAQKGLSSDQLSFVNYWFRHIWEYWWPMYPGVLLAVVIAELNLALFVVLMVPLTLAAIYFGQRPIRSFHNSINSQKPAQSLPAKPFLWEMLPILIAIVPGLCAGVLMSSAFPRFTMAKETALVSCLCIAIIWIWRENQFSGDLIRRLLINKNLLNIFYMVAAIMIFKGILADSQAVKAISDELISLKIPLLIIIAFLPFLVGLVCGIAIAFVGSTFPILIPMIHSVGESQFMLAYIMFAMVCGFAGVLLSPLHLCLILSNDYFKTQLLSVYKHLWLPCAALVFSAFGYFWLLHWACIWL